MQYVQDGYSVNVTLVPGGGKLFKVVPSPANVSEVSNSNTLNIPVYPIPTNNILNVKLPYNYDNYNVEVFDIYGKQIYTVSSKPGIEQIDLSNQSKGVYFLKIIANNEIIAIKKVILME